jgi:hypothetical protein
MANIIFGFISLTSNIFSDKMKELLNYLVYTSCFSKDIPKGFGRHSLRVSRYST